MIPAIIIGAVAEAHFTPSPCHLLLGVFNYPRGLPLSPPQSLPNIPKHNNCKDSFPGLVVPHKVHLLLY